MASVPKRTYSAPAAACAGEILRALTLTHEPLSLTELERQTGRTKSLVFRALRELEALELVTRVQERRYRLGLAAFEVGAAYLAQEHALESIRETLRSLADRSGESANLGVLRGGDVLYLMKFEASDSYVTLSRVGGRVPASCTAIGKALLAALPPARLREVVTEPLTQMTPASARTFDELERELEVTRARGYSVDRGEAVSARGGIAMTVPFLGDDTGNAAISLSTNLENLAGQGEARLLGLVREASERITREVLSHRVLSGTH